MRACLARYGILTELNLSQNRMTQLPTVIKSVARQLRVVLLADNQFKRFPTNVFRDMPQVRRRRHRPHHLPLWCTHSVAWRVARGGGQLRRLHFNGNKLQEFGFLNAERLTHFHLSHNRIKHLGNIADLRALETLQLDHNRLVKLPAKLRKMRSLKHLYLHHNQLASLALVDFRVRARLAAPVCRRLFDVALVSTRSLAAPFAHSPSHATEHHRPCLFCPGGAREAGRHERQGRVGGDI